VLRSRGLQAAADMAALTWSGAADQFHAIAAGLAPSAGLHESFQL
jgi:hypothetical protein